MSPVKVAALVCGALLVLLGGLGLFVFSIIQVTAPPRDSAHVFLGHVRAGRDDAAWSSTTRAFQETVPRAEFSPELRRALPAIARSTDATFTSTTIADGVACLGGSLDTPEGKVPIHARLVHERDRWRVQELSTAPLPSCRFASSSY